MKKNKIKFNLKRVHVAIQHYSDGVYTYETPVALPGAVNLSLEPEGESSPFYADGLVYFRAMNNNGYSGDLEIALVTEWFRENILQEIRDTNGVLVEKSDIVDPVYFALLFEFDGDIRSIRHVMYNCSITGRPSVASQTKEDNIEPVTETLSIACSPREDYLVKARTSDDTGTDVYTGWFSSVYVPGSVQDTGTQETQETQQESAALTSLAIGSLSLSPAFNASTYAYSTETSNASDTVTAVAGEGGTVAVSVNNSTLTNGEAASWQEGTNTVVVTVSEEDKEPATYTVTVTKAAG